MHREVNKVNISGKDSRECYKDLGKNWTLLGIRASELEVVVLRKIVSLSGMLENSMPITSGQQVKQSFNP